MRVAILTRDYPPAIGGIATHVEGLVKSLANRGVETDVFVGSNDVKTLLLPFDIRLKDYDVVHVQSAPYGAFVYGVPLVVTVHSPVLEEFDHYRRSLKFASMPAITLEKISLTRAKAVLAVSRQSRNEVIGMYGIKPEKVDVIGNGVYYGRFAAGASQRTDGSNKVLVVSRLEPRKNVAEAIAAIAELPRGSCTLEVVGDGSERSALTSLAKSLGAEDRVRFLGRVNGELLPELYRGAQVFLTTSNSEGFGLSLLEAMSSGCACVASDLPTHRSLIDDGVSGMIYKDHKDLVARLGSLLASPEEAERMGVAAKEKASGHTWDMVAGKVLNAYQRVVGDRN